MNVRVDEEDENIEKHPYIKYKNKGFELFDFIKMVYSYKGYFISYCEILVTDKGLIYLASPSHDREDKYLKDNHISKNNIYIWYVNKGYHDKETNAFYINGDKLNTYQYRTIKGLLDNGIINVCMMDY